MKISIRYQLLALIVGIVAAAMLAFTYLASNLFIRDKLAYIYDLNSSLANTVSEEVRANVQSLVDRLRYFAAVAGEARTNVDRSAEALLSTDDDILSLEIWESKAGTGFVRTFHATDSARLASLNLSEDDLAESRRRRPLPIDAVLAEGVVLQNASVPPDSAILTLAASTSDRKRVVVADLRPDRLLRIFGRSPLYRVYLVDGRGNIVAHPDADKVIARENVSAVPVVRDAIEGKLSRGVREFDSRAGPLIGAFSRVDLGRLAVVAEVPRKEALRASEVLLERARLFALGLLFVAILASVYFARRLTAPLRRLENATTALARGDYSVQVPVTTRNEIGSLAVAFNRMKQELADREARLGEAHTQLVQSEKLSAVGEISASVVHEVKNPMVGIIGFAQMGQTAATEPEKQEYFQLIESHAWRANEVLQGLLKFARMDKPDFEALDANTVVQGAVRLVEHQLHLKKVKLDTHYQAEIPRILGNANQLQQVLVNLIVNAQHAMEESAQKELHVSTAASNGTVAVAIRDTGVGMTDEVKSRIFTPFFTTKPAGKGSGLGLSVSQRIVTQHHGRIEVDSEVGKGTTFYVRLPIAGEGSSAAVPST
jgi:two-component system, NtrC family, sensor kinase